MRASQELRWKQRIKENEERRRRYEEASKRLEMEEKEKAHRALEERRAERARMDDLMRNPAQAPAPPKKPILRKGAGAVLRSPPRAAGSHSSQRPATVPTQPSTAVVRSPSRSPVRAATACAERPRREWSEGLKQFIAGQREAAKPGLPQGMFPAVDDALSWQELKLAAEAGFEELIRMQEAAAAAAAQQPNPAWRRPGMTRATGGGGNTAEAWAGPAAQLGWPAQGFATDFPVQSSSQHVAAPPAAGNTGSSATGGSNRPLVSKWAARMQQAKPASATEPSCSVAQAQQAVGAAAAVQAGAQQGAAEGQHQQQEQTAVQHLQPQLPEPAGAQEVSAVADEQLAAGRPRKSMQGVAAVNGEAECSEVSTYCPSNQRISPAGRSGHDDEQHLTAAAAQATAALRASMDQLHRSTQLGATNRTMDHAATATAEPETEPAVEAAAAQPESATTVTSDVLQLAPQAAAQLSRQQSSADGGNSSAGTGESRRPCSSSATRQHSCSSSMDRTILPEEPEVANAAELLLSQPGDMLTAASGSGGQAEQAAAADVMQTGSGMDMGQQDAEVLQQQEQPALPQEQALQEPANCVANFESAVGVPWDWAAECGQTDSPGASPCSEDQEAGSACEQQDWQQADGPVAAAAAATSTQPSVLEEVAAASRQTSRALSCSQTATDADVPLCADAAAAAANQPQQQQHKQQQEQEQEQQQQQQQQQASGGASTACSTTLDALLAEAKQLAALRRAVGAEFAAMGRSRVAAVMGADEADTQPPTDSGLAKVASAAVADIRPLQAVQAAAQLQVPVVEQQALHRQVSGNTSAAAPAGCAAAWQAETRQVQGSSSAGIAAVPAPSAAASQQYSQPAAAARLSLEDPDMVTLKQLGQQQPRLLQQESVWLPISASEQQLDWQAQQQVQQPEQRSPQPSQQDPGRRLGQLSLSRGSSSQLALSPLQQDTGGSAPQGRQLCFTSNPLYRSSPPSPMQEPNAQVVTQQHQMTQRQQVGQQKQALPRRIQNQQAAQQGAVQQQAATHMAVPDQQAHFEHLGPSDEQAQYQRQLLQDQQQPGLTHAQRLPLPAPAQEDTVDPADTWQHASVQHPVWQQQQQQHHLEQQQQQQVCQQQQQHERAQSLLHPRSAARQRPRTEPGTGQSHHATLNSVHQGDTQQGYWSGPVASPLQGHDADPASVRHVQQAWGVEAGPTGPSDLLAQHMWGAAPDRHNQWDCQQGAAHSAPMAVSAVLPVQYAHMQHAAYGAADLAHVAIAPQLHPRGHDWPMDTCGAPPAAFGWNAAVTASKQLPAMVTGHAASAVGAAAMADAAEAANVQCRDEPVGSNGGSTSGSSSAAGNSRFLSKLASKVKSAVGRMAAGAMHHTPQQQQQQQQEPAQLPPKSPRQQRAQPAAGEQGSYVAAALLAQQRAEAEAAERERIKAAAEAAKQAAARKAAAERAEAQRKAADQAAQNTNLVPVAIGSYARQQSCSQQQPQPQPQQQQQQQVQVTYHVSSDTNQQLDSCSAEGMQAQRHARLHAVTTLAPVAARMAAVSAAKQPAGRQPCTPQAPQSPADQHSSPRRKAVRPAGRSQVQQQVQATGTGAADADAAGVLARAADQYAPVSRIPGAPGTKPSTPPQLSCRSAAQRHVPAEMGAHSVHQMHQQQQQQSAGASHCQADSDDDDDDFAHLERELQDDGTCTATAAQAAANKGQSYWDMHHTDSTRDGYQQQQHQEMLMQQQKQLMQQQQQQLVQQQQQQLQQMSQLAMPLGVPSLQAAWAPGMQESPRPQGMWAAVHAAAAASASKGQQQVSVAAAGPPGHPQVQVQQQLDTHKAASVTASSHSHSGPAKLRPLATGAVPPSTRRAAMHSSTAPEVPTSSNTTRPAPVAAAVATKQPVPAKTPEPQAGRTAPKQQHQQQPSRLSLEEASLLAELQQLDQRMHHTDQHRDAPPSTAKLPAAASAAGSPSKARGTTARAAAVAAKSPVRSAATTVPAQRGGIGAVVKLAAIRGASRGSSASSSSGCDVPPSSAHRQQHQKAAKQAKLVSVSRTAAAAADKTRAPSPQKTPPAISAAAAAAAAGPACPTFAPWGLPAGTQTQLDPRLGSQMPHGSTGMFPGAPMGPQGYWMGPGSAMMAVGQPGAAWPEGPAAAAAGAGQWHPQALQRQQGPGSTWQGKQQPMWWPGQMPPQYAAAGQPYTPHMHPGLQSGMQGGCGAYSAGSGGMMPQQQQYSRPGSGMPYHMPGSCPPLTAPSGFGHPPGSPLLPTLHYQETVMRNRTSSSGSAHTGYQDRGFDGSSGGGSRWGSAGSASSGSSRGQQGDAGCGSGWASRVSQEAANVWPPRGVEKSILSGIKGGRATKGEDDGDIVVYNAHLLLS